MGTLKINPSPAANPADKPARKESAKQAKKRKKKAPPAQEMTGHFLVIDHDAQTFVVIEGRVKAKHIITSTRTLDWLNRKFKDDALYVFHKKGVDHIG